MLHNDIVIAVSVVDDGTMKKVGHADPEQVDENRIAWLGRHGVDIKQTVLVSLDYATDDFCHYSFVDQTMTGDGMTRRSTMTNDALATHASHVALFLPLADCVGAVLYDPMTKILMLSHLGRHNLEQHGGQKSVEYLAKEHTVDPKNLLVWLSPSAGKENYPLFNFDHTSLQQVTIEQMLAAGVYKENITPSNIDTTKCQEYFSHSEYKKGHRQTDGRFAVLAMIK
jgi:copper oxidase (laccase) domain-containing protein